MIDFLGWIGNIFFILGACTLSNKNKTGFIYNAIANFIYIIFAVVLKTTSLAILSVVLVAINMRGFIYWRRKHGKEKD